MNIHLAGRRALVCGSTQGIGRAIAEIFAESGANVTLIARNEQMLEEVRSGLATGSGQTHSFIVADFADPGQLASKIAGVAGDTDILVNNTGGPPPGPVLEAGTDDFTGALTRHLFAGQALVQAVVPGMKTRSFGRIINIISTSVRQPIPGLGVSNTVRGAMASWSKTLSLELAPFGITVNNILPGATSTERLSSLITRKSQESGRDQDEVRREMLGEVPAGRFAEPREPGYLACFLASDLASYITGTSIAVDGGRTRCL